MHPQIPILLTFFSPSGYEVRKNYPLADRVCYLPIDLPGSVDAFLDTHQPLFVVFVKYEIWHTLLRSLHRRGVDAFLISARFRPGQVYFRGWGRFFLRSLRTFRHIYVQDQSSHNLLLSQGIESTIAGDTRYDRVAHIASTSPPIPLLEKWVVGKRVVVAGSTWPADEDVLWQAFAKWSHGATPLLIIAPHEVNPERVAKLAAKREGAALWSQMEGADLTDVRVLIIDAIGLLSSIYRYADVCYIGGGFGAGIHNTLEAAAWGKPIVFGPKYLKFTEAIDLIAMGAAIAINNSGEALKAFETYLLEPVMARTAGTASAKLVRDNQGATALILQTLSTVALRNSHDS